MRTGSKAEGWWLVAGKWRVVSGRASVSGRQVAATRASQHACDGLQRGQQLRLCVQVARRDEHLCKARAARYIAAWHVRHTSTGAWYGLGHGHGMCMCMCMAWARRSTRSYAARGGAPWTSITIPRAVAAAAASSRSSASALTQSMRRGLCASKSATSAALQPSKSTLARLLRPTSWDRLPASSHEAAAESASVSIHTSDVPCGDAEVRWVERKGYPKSV